MEPDTPPKPAKPQQAITLHAIYPREAIEIRFIDESQGKKDDSIGLYNWDKSFTVTAESEEGLLEAAGYHITNYLCKDLPNA